jgi:iron-sulfur cluster assembly accessory protein
VSGVGRGVRSNRNARKEQVEMVTLSDTAVTKIGEILVQQKQEGKALRIYVEGGGCSGFQYGFAFDEARDGDEVVEYPSFRLLIDPFSFNYLESASVDYVDGLDGAGFRINNPQATGSCGCGKSFSA